MVCPRRIRAGVMKRTDIGAQRTSRFGSIPRRMDGADRFMWFGLLLLFGSIACGAVVALLVG